MEVCTCTAIHVLFLNFASWLHLSLHGALLLCTNFSFFSHLLITSAMSAIPDASEEEGGMYEPLYTQEHRSLHVERTVP